MAFSGLKRHSWAGLARTLMMCLPFVSVSIILVGILVFMAVVMIVIVVVFVLIVVLVRVHMALRMHVALSMFGLGQLNWVVLCQLFRE